MKNPSKLSRREFVTVAASGLSLITPGFLRAFAPKYASAPSPARMGADEALHELLAGNSRFSKGKPTSPRRSPEEFRELAEHQYPNAVIVSCSDSRVAPEILFDVGIGDIFVVRIAGNVVNGAGVTVKGSIEYAVAELNVPLIMVLGHSGCGAVKAAMKHIDEKDSIPGSINGLVELIKPAVAQSKQTPGNALENAIRKNVEIGVGRLKEVEPILAPAVKDGKIKVVGGVYDLATGVVTLL